MIYHRHLIRTLLIPLGMTLSGVVALVWLGQIMKLSFIIEFGVGIIQFIFLTLAALPTVTLSIIPLAATVACFFGYNYLHSDRELIALSASGFSRTDIAMPAIKLAGSLTIFGYLLSFYLSPISYHMLKEDMNYFRSNYISSIVHERTFNMLTKNVVLFVDHKESSSKMHGIIIFDHRNAAVPITVFAKMGKLSMDGSMPVFELHDGLRQEVHKNGQMNQMTFSNLLISLPSKHDSRSKTSIDLQEYTISDLMYPKDDYTEARLRKMMAEKHQRFVWPGYIMALVLLTLAIYLREPYSRTGHKTVIIKISLAISGVLYLHFTFHNLASDTPIFNIMCYANLLCTMAIGWWMLRVSE